VPKGASVPLVTLDQPHREEVLEVLVAVLEQQDLLLALAEAVAVVVDGVREMEEAAAVNQVLHRQEDLVVVGQEAAEVF
jgi:sulfur transfer complex TusBCD TusB component (DsrH family)